jgi:hypothetical protein
VEAFAGVEPFTVVDDDAGNGVLARQDGVAFAGGEFFTGVDASVGNGVLYWPDGEVFSDGKPFTGVAAAAGAGTGDLCRVDGEGISRREPLPGADAETGTAAMKGGEHLS